jgi:ribonuclease HII
VAILGIDEVGRGPWAGPLVVGAVVLPDDFDTSGLADSKQLSKSKREALAAQLTQLGSNIGLGWVPAAELDQIGLSAALCTATRRAVASVTATFHEIIIDGTVNFLRDTPLERYVTTLPKADALIPAVSAASIVAKVARDRYMAELIAEYPDYGFESHVGYGTAAHRRALEAYGPTPEHRLSFRPLARWRPEGWTDPAAAYPASDHPNHAPNRATTTASGNRAEAVVADALIRRGHRLLARNWHTPRCEIDLISVRADKIYFTEVKYRATAARGDGLAAITPTKQRQMRFAAAVYLKSHPSSKQPLLQAAAVSGPDYHLDQIVTL